MRQQRVLDLTGEFEQEGVIVDSTITEDDITLIYTIAFKNNDGCLKHVQREPYQITYL